MMRANKQTNKQTNNTKQTVEKNKQTNKEANKQIYIAMKQSNVIIRGRWREILQTGPQKDINKTKIIISN